MKTRVAPLRPEAEVVISRAAKPATYVDRKVSVRTGLKAPGSDRGNSVWKALATFRVSWRQNGEVAGDGIPHPGAEGDTSAVMSLISRPPAPHICNCQPTSSAFGSDSLQSFYVDIPG